MLMERFGGLKTLARDYRAAVQISLILKPLEGYTIMEKKGRLNIESFVKDFIKKNRKTMDILASQ